MPLLDLLFPKRCVTCRKIGKYICPVCRKKIEFIPNQICPECYKPSIQGLTYPRCGRRYSLDGLLAFATFSGPVRWAIHKLKYKLISDLAEELIRVALSNKNTTSILEGLVNKDWIVIPVPLHPQREKLRGFNQAEILAKFFAKEFNLEMNDNLLKRAKNTKSQVDLSAKERRKNVQGAFSCDTKKFDKNKNFLLIDDLVTTGSTLSNCASALKRKSARKVWGLTLARSIPFKFNKNSN